MFLNENYRKTVVFVQFCFVIILYLVFCEWFLLGVKFNEVPSRTYVKK